jgi:glutamyl-Q tRNA(Asp) synthetase
MLLIIRMALTILTADELEHRPAMPQPVFRFAPSPNGELHLGHAYSALFTERAAGEIGGLFLLRIEDIDGTRCRPEFTASIFADLAWLGLSWPEPVRFQSSHLDDYAAARDRLRDMGLLYPCFCTRKDIAAAGAFDPEGNVLYAGTCRKLAASAREDLIAEGAPFSLRLDMEKACRMSSGLVFVDEGEGEVKADPRRWGDVVLVRKDIHTSYHLSVVIDDAIQGITHVTRGRDLFAATHIHRLLQALLDLPTPLYHHHRLITTSAGRKLAKSLHDPSLRMLRSSGVTPAQVRQGLGFAP